MEEPGFMLKLYTMSQYGSYHISVILGVVSTDYLAYQPSVVATLVNGENSFYARTVIPVSVRFPSIMLH